MRIDLNELFSKKLILVSGKGGVGKTTVSLALALLAAERGKKTLLAEINAEGQVAHLLERKPSGYPEEKIFPGLWGINIVPRKSFEEYVLLQIKFKTIYRAVFENKFVRYFLEATPGLGDLMCIGKVYAATNQFDLVIVDAPATGHGISLLQIASTVAKAVKIGPLKNHSQKIDELLHDPARTQVVQVTLPEEMPVTESLEMQAWLKQAWIPSGLLFLNQFRKNFLTPQEEDELDSLKNKLSLTQASLAPLKAMALEQTRAELSDSYYKLLKKELSDVTIMKIPFLYTPEFKLSEVQQVADLLANTLERGGA